VVSPIVDREQLRALRVLRGVFGAGQVMVLAVRKRDPDGAGPPRDPDRPSDREVP